MRKKIRVVQFGLGPIGASIARLMRRNTAIEIVGAIDKDPAKAGRDLGEVAGASDAPWGVVISAESRPALEKSVDIVVHSTSSYLTSVMDQLMECLAAGCCIVSTCEELAYPWKKHPELSKQLDDAAKEEGVALLGTGVNPGFVMDKLVLTLSAVSQRVDWASAVRIVDASKRRLPLQKKIGAGMTPEEFRAQVAAGVIKHHGLPESIAMVADGLGFALDDISETIDPVIAEEEAKTEFLASRARTSRWSASSRSRDCFRQRKNLYGAQNVRRSEASFRHHRIKGRAKPFARNTRRDARGCGYRCRRSQRNSRDPRCSGRFALRARSPFQLFPVCSYYVKTLR